jgi:tetraacyldisaccharide 4'-kinase
MHSAGVPVVVVGNINAGGTGKTPVTLWLARALKHKGYSPGIVSRGYGGDVGPVPVRVTADSDPSVVGDEALVLAAQSGCATVVHPDRVAAAREAARLGADIIVSDDGLQHYRLGRDVELVVVDGERGFGNGTMLPAGPLRESLSRLDSVDAVLLNGGERDIDIPALRQSGAMRFELRATAVARLNDSEVRHIDDFADQAVHAVAGIGHPERFFSMLESRRIEVIRHPLPDHAAITMEDVRFDDELEVLMTQKDAVKCKGFDSARLWYVPVEVEFDGEGGASLLELIESKTGIRESRP